MPITPTPSRAVEPDACSSCPLTMRVCRKCLKPVVFGGIHGSDGNDYHTRHAPWKLRFPTRAACARIQSVLRHGQ